MKQALSAGPLSLGSRDHSPCLVCICDTTWSNQGSLKKVDVPIFFGGHLRFYSKVRLVVSLGKLLNPSAKWCL